LSRDNNLSVPQMTMTTMDFKKIYYFIILSNEQEKIDNGTKNE